VAEKYSPPILDSYDGFTEVILDKDGGWENEPEALGRVILMCLVDERPVVVHIREEECI
jgi:hypothetical protein